MNSNIRLLGVDERWMRHHLFSLGVRPGMKLVVHSSLIAFGKIDGGEELIFRLLSEMVGAKGALAFPTFTLAIKPDEIYDPLLTQPVGCGRLSLYAFHAISGKRSQNPMHSYKVFGSNTLIVERADWKVSYGANSIFELLDREGWFLLLLGVGVNDGATFLHHLEQVANVPYREILELNRKVKGIKGVEDVVYKYFGRVGGSIYVNDFNLAEKDLVRDDILKFERALFGRSLMGKLDSIQLYILNRLKQNPYYLVK